MVVVCNSAGLEFCVDKDDLGLLISCLCPVLGHGRVTDVGRHAQLLLRFSSGFLGYCVMTGSQEVCVRSHTCPY